MTTRMRGPCGRLDAAERLEVEDRLVHRDGDVVRRFAANELVEQLGVVDRQHVERSHHDALVGDPETHLGGELGAVEQLAQRLGERDRVGDLAVAQRSPGRRSATAPLRDRDVAVDRDLGGREVARVQLEPDDGVLLAAA